MNQLKNRNMRLKLFNLIHISLILILLAGCKHAEKVVIERKLKPVSVRRLVRMVGENELKFNTLSVKNVSLPYKNESTEKSVKALYKIRRDSVIQVKAQMFKIPVANMELDKDSFRVVKYVGKELMSGSFDDISELTGIDIDYQTIQAILSNHMQSIKQDQRDYPFRDYGLSIAENMYKISSLSERRFRKFTNHENKLERYKQRNDEAHLIKHDIFVDPDIFVVRKVIFNDLSAGIVVTIVFSEFKELHSKWFPGKKKMEVKVELSKVTIDEAEDFGFSMPSKYKRMNLKNP